MRRRFQAFWLLLFLCGAAPVSAAEPRVQSVTVIRGEQKFVLPKARVGGGALWLAGAANERVSGYKLKPGVGLCAAELCIPIPPKAGWARSFEGEIHVDVVAFAALIDQAVAAEPEKAIWSFGEPSEGGAHPLLSGLAPDFALPDRSGKLVRLSSFRGKKVLILSWASW